MAWYLPTDQRGSAGQAAAHAAQKNQLTGLEMAGFISGLERNRDRRRRGVAVTFDHQGQLLHRDSAFFCQGLQHSSVGLVEDEMIHVREREAVVLHGSMDRLLKLPDHDSEEAISFHPDRVEPLVFYDGWRSQSASWYLDEIALRSIGMKMTGENPTLAIRRLKENRARTIAE